MLNYEKKGKLKEAFPLPEIYHLDSLYEDEGLAMVFKDLKLQIVDLNTSFITKCITGTEADFLLLMERAEEYLKKRFPSLDGEYKAAVLQMFSDAVFGYYVLTPLVKDPKVSDFKVLSWDHITCKVNGKRYVSDITFSDQEDYDAWFSRIIAIQRGRESDEYALQHFTDRRGVDEFFLRIDAQLRNITSQEVNNIHVRKIPKTKYSWEYLKQAGMLDDETEIYLHDRIDSGYGFLISGRGGSGKSTLLNNMLDIIPLDESILVVQESDELYSDHPQAQFEHILTAQTKTGIKEFTLEDELRLGLLQDIDVLIVGEIKGEEALSCIQTSMNTGSAFMGTIHSNNARSSLIRMAQCAKLASDYSMETLIEMMASIPLVLIHMSHFSIDEIVEVCGWDDKENKAIFRQVYEKG